MVWRSFCLYTGFSISNVSIAKSLYVFEAPGLPVFWVFSQAAKTSSSSHT